MNLPATLLERLAYAPVMPGLAVNTEAGKPFREYAERAVELLLKAYPQYDFSSTNKASGASYDGMLIDENDELMALVEVKTRQLSFSDFADRYSFKAYIHPNKLKLMSDVSRASCASSLYLFYLIPDDLLLVEQLCSRNGNIYNPQKEETRITQATCNGGQKITRVQFVDLTRAAIIGPDGIQYDGTPHDVGDLDLL